MNINLRYLQESVLVTGKEPGMRKCQELCQKPKCGTGYEDMELRRDEKCSGTNTEKLQTRNCDL